MTLPATCDTEHLAAVVFHPDLTDAQARVVLARWCEPDVPVAELARRLGTARSTVQRVLGRARALGLPAAAVRHLPHQGGTPCRTRAAPAAAVRHPQDDEAALSGAGQGQAQAPPTPPRATPPPTHRATEPVQGQLLEDPARQVVALRKANGLAGRNVRTIARVLLEMADEGHPQAEVIEALGRCLVVSGPSCSMTMNEGKVARAPVRKPAPYAATHDPAAWAEAAATATYRTWRPDD